MQSICSKFFIAAMLSVVTATDSATAEETCKVIITSENGTVPVELVVARFSRNDSETIAGKTKLENGSFECTVTTPQIETYDIYDLGEMNAKGSTGRLATFFVENGATVRAVLDGDEIRIQSDGKEQQKWNRIQHLTDSIFKPAFDEAGNIADESQRDAAYKKINDDYYNKLFELCSSEPTIGYLLELESKLDFFSFNSSRIGRMLKIYHDNYTVFHPEHSVHKKIADFEAADYQIVGGNYHDYFVRTAEGKQVAASEFIKGRPTMVIFWATWCHPCRKECIIAKDKLKKYIDRGLNVVSIAREFTNLDNFNKALAEDNYPWPCLYDLDNEFNVFDKHGVSSGGIYLIDADGKIVSTGYEVDEFSEKLASLFPEN